MPYVRDSFWRGREFTSLAHMQAAAVDWCRDVAGQRSHRGLDGAAPAAVFAAVERPALRPLPRTGFVLATWSTGKVGPDIHVKVGPALYSVPWRLIGQRVQARCTATSVQIIHDGTVVATHVRAERGRRTNPDQYPPEKIAFHLRTPTWCRTTAQTVGPACRQVIEALLVDNALFRIRGAQGILALRGKHGPAALERACATALAAGDPSYRTIKGILALTPPSTRPAGLTHRSAGPERGAAAAVPAFLRGQHELSPASPVAGTNVVLLPTTSVNPTTNGTTNATTNQTSNGSDVATEAAR
jgi:hypothetical protein